MLQQFLSALTHSARALMLTALGVILVAMACPQAHAGLNPYSRFMKVGKWNFQWTVVWQAQGQDMYGDGVRVYDYDGTSSGSVEMDAEYAQNPFSQTWRVPDGTDAQGGINYDETITAQSSVLETTYVSSGPGSYDSFPLSIDAVKGTCDISIPDVSFENTIQTVSQNGSEVIKQTVPFTILSWPPYDTTFIAKNWSQLRLPAEGLIISGKYIFSATMPIGSILIPGGVTCTVNYTYTPVDVKEDLKAKPKVATSV